MNALRTPLEPGQKPLMRRVRHFLRASKALFVVRVPSLIVSWRVEKIVVALASMMGEMPRFILLVT
jgi:hypothetical protein